MPSKEPVIWSGLARIIVLVAGHWGFKADPTSLIAAMVAIEVALSPFIRSKVTPVAVSAPKS